MSTTLDDLRRANLAEQRQDGEQQSARTAVQTAVEGASPAELSAGTDVQDSVNAEVRRSVDTEVRTDGLTQVRKDVSKAARKRGRTQGSEAVREHEQRRSSADFLERVRTAVDTKKTHAGGVKTTVEMTPDLNLRAKRYALDHGNVPVRQIFLELMTAFLDEEGY